MLTCRRVAHSGANAIRSTRVVGQRRLARQIPVGKLITGVMVESVGRAFTISGRLARAVCVLCLLAVALLAPPAAHAADPVNAIEAGAGTTCGLTDMGGVECWGWNFYGSLGIGTANGPQNCGGTAENPVACSITPVAVKGLGSGVSALTAGYAHACALTSAGGVECWGYNTAGQLGDGTNTGPQLCSKYPTPCSTVPVAVSGLSSGVSALGSGWDLTCAVTSAGGVECWGDNGDGQLGDGTTTDSSTPVAVQLPAGVKATAIAGGGQHMCAVTSAGGVECWGYNEWGQLGDGTDSGPQTCKEHSCSTVPVAVQLPEGVTATAIASGGYHTCVVTSSGGVDCWGRGEEGELGNGTTTESWTPVPVQLPQGVTVTAIAAESYHTCVLTSTGNVLCWGPNDDGQLGDGTDTGPQSCEEEPCSTVPVAVGGLESGARAITAGWEYACAVGEAGGVQCWGYDGTGGLGVGNTAFSLTPAPVLELMSSLSVSAAGAGSGTVSSSAAGIDCGGPGHTSCTALFAPSSTVLVRATPTSGSGFVGFVGAGCSGAGTTCVVPMSEEHAVTATFARAPLASIAAPADGGIYTVGEAVPTSFSCTEGTSGPGLASCNDSSATSTTGGGSGQLDTSTVGAHTYTVTATSKDGSKTSASIGYTVTSAPGSPPPGTSIPDTPAPGTPMPHTPTPGSPALKVSVLSGSALVEHRRAGLELSCSGGVAGSACRGTLVLTLRRRIARRIDGHRRLIYETIMLARAGYEVRSAHGKMIVLRLTSAGLRLLGSAHHRRMQARAAATVSGGRTAHRTLTLRTQPPGG